MDSAQISIITTTYLVGSWKVWSPT